MDRAVPQRPGERVVHKTVLVEERQPLEARARDDHLEMVTAARAVLDAQLRRVGKRAAQQRFEALDSHAAHRTGGTAVYESDVYWAVAGSYVGAAAAGVCRSYVPA